jgi:hypothetical protein
MGHAPGACQESTKAVHRQNAVLIVVDAAQAYGPQYVHQMANGATVIGPVR